VKRYLRTLRVGKWSAFGPDEVGKGRDFAFSWRLI